MSTVTTTYSSDVAVGFAYESPESAAELARTIARLRATVNALTASSSAPFPRIIPALTAINAMLDVASLLDLEASSPGESRQLRSALSQLSNQLGDFAHTLCRFAPAVSPSQPAFVLPEFRGFQDDAEEWVATVNAAGAREAWTEAQ